MCQSEYTFTWVRPRTDRETADNGWQTGRQTQLINTFHNCFKVLIRECINEPQYETHQKNDRDRLPLKLSIAPVSKRILKSGTRKWYFPVRITLKAGHKYYQANSRGSPPKKLIRNFDHVWNQKRVFRACDSYAQLRKRYRKFWPSSPLTTMISRHCKQLIEEHVYNYF